MRVSFSKFSYQKLKQEVIFQDEYQLQPQQQQQQYPKFDVIRRSFSLRRNRFTRIRPRRLKLRLRLRLRLKLRIAGFKKLFRMRRVRVGGLSWAKFVKRFKESQSHFGDLFSGNYLFMQVSPSSLKNNRPYLSHHNHHHLNNNNFHVNNDVDDKLHGFASSKFNSCALQKLKVA